MCKSLRNSLITKTNFVILSGGEAGVRDRTADDTIEAIAGIARSVGSFNEGAA